MRVRHDHVATRARGNVATSLPNSGVSASVAPSVPRNSHGRRSPPPIAPISSRIGRST
jgi:hypothetical protein